MDTNIDNGIKEFYSDLIFKRTYAKTQNETWDEAVQRYADHFRKSVPQELQEEYSEAISLFKQKRLLGSMRALATAGKALELYPEALYNCSYIVFNSYSDFADMMLLLMLGVGVGYSVEKHTIGLPKRPEEFIKGSYRIQIDDSKEGWRDSFLALLTSLQQGLIPRIDYTKIRPAGEPLKTFGGKASGSEPLRFLFNHTIELFESNKGEPWTPEDIFDLANLIANTVISGGVRRSACIALADAEDAYKLKPRGFWESHPWRAYSNISITKMPEDFLNYTLYLQENGNGEPGLFNRKAALKKLEKTGREPGNQLLGANPCLVGDTEILTDIGNQKIRDLALEQSFNIINKDGNTTKSYAWFTGTKDVYDIKNGPTVLLTATSDHKLMTNTGEELEVKDIKGHRLMPYINVPTHNPLELLMGFLQGDGTLTHLYNEDNPYVVYNINKTKDQEITQLIGATENKDRHIHRTDIVPNLQEWGFSNETLIKRELPKVLTDKTNKLLDVNQIKAFLSGLFSANGSVITKYRVALNTSNYNLGLQVMDLLDLLGISSYMTTNKEHNNKFPNGTYKVSESYDINIGKRDSIMKFANEINFIQKYKQDALRDLLINYKAPLVTNVVYKGKEDVYDFTEPETHWGVANGYVCHNCGEILLRPYQFCNLTEVHVEPQDTLESLKNKVKKATLLAGLQSMSIPENTLNKAWRINATIEPLLGVSLTGLRTHAILGEISEKASEWLEELKDVAHEYSKSLGTYLGMKFTAVTTVKPSGTASQILGTTSGLHPSFSKYYLRRIRINRTDDLVKILEDAPVNFEKDINNKDTLVMSFPMYMENHKYRGIQDQLEFYSQLATHWADHNPSCTINVADYEWQFLSTWLDENWKNFIGITFLPRFHSLPQAPYEEIDKDTYLEYIPKWESYLKDSQQQSLSFSVDIPNKTNQTTFSCSAGHCEVDDL